MLVGSQREEIEKRAETLQACRELLCGGCKKGCRGRCKCRLATLQCPALCHCSGFAVNDIFSQEVNYYSYKILMYVRTTKVATQF